MTQLANILRVKSEKPEPGMGCTFFHYTDRSCGTVVRISASGKTVWVKADRAVRIDKNGMSECQHYRYERMEGPAIRVSLRKDGQWRDTSGMKVAFGFRDAYHDYSF